MHSCYESTINNMEWIKYPFIQEVGKGSLFKCMKCSNPVCRGMKWIVSKFNHYNLHQLPLSMENFIIYPCKDIFSLSATKNKIDILNFRYI